MEIRRLQPTDAAIYQEIRLEGLRNNPDAFGSSYEEETEYSIEKYQQRFQSGETYTYGAFENNKLIGVVTLMIEQKIKLYHKASIVAMYVTSEKSGLGIGRNLMKTAIKKAESLKQIKQINLSVVTSNIRAKRLYASLGFEVYGLEKRALKLKNHYLDEEYMVLYLD